DNAATGATADCDDATAVADDDPADGAFLVSDLPANTYSVAAVTPPPNYELPDETKTFTLEDAAADAPESSGTNASESSGTNASETSGADAPETTEAGQPLRGAAASAFVLADDNVAPVQLTPFVFQLTATPTIVVHLGGYRTGGSTVGPLPAGATLQAVPVGGGTTL